MKKYDGEKSVRVQFYLNTEKEGERAIYEYIKEVMEETYIPESAAVKSILRKAINKSSSNPNESEETVKEIEQFIPLRDEYKEELSEGFEEYDEIQEEGSEEVIEEDSEEYDEDDINDMLSGI